MAKVLPSNLYTVPSSEIHIRRHNCFNEKSLFFLIFYRFRDTSSSFDASSKRYVITNPPVDFQLLPTDQVSFIFYMIKGIYWQVKSKFVFCHWYHSNTGVTAPCHVSTQKKLIQRAIFQTFWRPYSCTDSLFLKLEISNIGYLPIFWFHISLSKIGQHWY